MNRGKLTLGQRFFIWFWRRLTKTMVGFPDRLAEEYVRTFGVREFLRWAKTTFEVVQMLEKRWGPAEAQMLASFAALWSGCRWCSVGHLLTGNLELFKGTGELGPLDERRVVDLQRQRDPEVLEILLECYSGSRWKEMSAMIHRQYQLRSGKVEEETSDDQLLQMTNYMWEWINECSITLMDIDPLTIPPQSPIGKDKKLLQRYREARQQKSLASGS